MVPALVVGLTVDASSEPSAPVGCGPGVTGTASASPGAPIPDNNPAPTTSAIPIAAPSDLRVEDLEVDLNLPHTFPGDLDMTLTSPAGTVATISTDNGASFDNAFAGTVFGDRAGAQNPSVNDFPYVLGTAGTPLGPEEAMAVFRGEQLAGTWTLAVVDDAGGDTGTLNSWGIRYLGLDPTVVPDRLTLSQQNSTSQAIPDGASGTNGPAVTSTIQISGAPAGASIEDAELFTSISHTFPGDLDVTLTSPAGTVETITTDNGGTSDDAYKATTWSDRAGKSNPPGPVGDVTYALGVPESPVAPEEPLNAFRGENPNGTWTLTMSDDAAADTGTLNNWGLDVTLASCGVPDLSASISDTPDPITAGDVVALPVTVRNNSAGQAQGVTSTVTLPAELELVSATPSQGSCTGATCDLGTIGGGAAAQILVVARGKAAGTPITSVSVAQSETESDLTNNTANTQTTVNAPPPPADTGGGTPPPDTGGTPPPDTGGTNTNNPPPDTTAPTIILLVPQSAKLGAVRKKGLTALVGCTEGCALSGQLLLPAKLAKSLKLKNPVGKGTLSLAAAGSSKFKIKLTRAARRALKSVKKAKLIFVVNGHDAAGNKALERRGKTKLTR